MKLSKSILIFFIFIYSVGYSAEHSLNCSQTLRPILKKIETLPEGRELVSKVLEKGPLYIKVNSHYSNQFEGYWNAYDRIISITKTSDSSECSLLTTLLFELHNAVRTCDLEEVYSCASHSQITKKEFVKAVEYIEYENACSTAKLLRKGASEGIFPLHCYWNVSNTFAEHFAIQKKAGHSAWIGKMYDQLVI